MRLLICLVFILIFCSCQKSYTLKISKDAKSVLGGFDRTDESVKFKADDDYSAYGQGAQKYLSEQVADSIMNYDVEHPISFTVYDSDGNDLRTKIGIKETDSIDRFYQGLKGQVGKSIGESLRKINKSN
jgi:hypothetical protein